MPRFRRGFDVAQAHHWLSRRDRRLGAWMKRLGPIDAQPGWSRSFDPVDALARAILFQQLSGKAAGEIPDLRRMSVMEHDAIIAALLPIRGIGRWTVEMMLMFRLGRPDILPIDDLGIRKGAQRVDKAEAMPTPKALQARGEKWGPFRTYASLYLWRIADFSVVPKAETNRSQG